MLLCLALVLLPSLHVITEAAIYLPGVSPRDFEDGDKIALKVNKIDSTHTHLPYDYYSLPFCRPEKIINDHENLGEVLSGDKIHNSPFEIFMNKNEYCKELCSKTYEKKEIDAFSRAIREGYHHNWIVDNLPSVWLDQSLPSDPLLRFDGGIPLGTWVKISNNLEHAKRNGQKYRIFLNNHFRIILQYHVERLAEGGEKKRIVGFQVAPYSITHQFDSNNLVSCSESESVLQQSTPIELTADMTILQVVWTYDVVWEQSEIEWESRWENYFRRFDSKVHWFSLINSMVIVLFLTGLVAMIMNRTLSKDIDRYNQAEEETLDEIGWKSVHGDVFRPPRYPALLAICAGTGAQLLAMLLLTLAFALLGLLSPANRGGLVTAMIMLFAFMGFVAGYTAARVYKQMLGKNWLRTTIATAALFPGIVFVIFFVLNLVVWHERSSSAVPFMTMFSILALWLLISAPLVCLGSYIGFTKPMVEPPVRINPLPREQVNKQSNLVKVLVVLLGGVLPFGVVFIEVFYILSSIWLDQYYYAFFFLFAVLVVLCITCAEISIVLCYFQLCRQDHHWWWRSFLASGCSGLYLFIYSLCYLAHLDLVRTVSSVLFIGYMFVASLFMFLIAGVVGLLATMVFVHNIYGAIKVN